MPTTQPPNPRTHHRGRVHRAAAWAATALVALALGVVVPATSVQAAIACGLNEIDQNVFLVNDGLWSNPVNWSRNHLPTSGEAVCVPGGVVAVVSSASSYLLGAQDGYITTLRVEGTIRIQGGNTVSLASAVYGGSNLFNGGVIQVLSGSTFDMNPDQNGAPAFQNVVGGSLIQVSSGSTIYLRRPFLNTGTINLTGGGALILDSPASGYSTGGSGGAVIGGQLQLRSGSVNFDSSPSSGVLSVLATGGGVRGTIASNQTLDLACKTFTTAIDMTNSLTNNGTMHFLPPLAGACELDYTLPGGTTLTNNGSLTFGNPGVSANGWVAFSSNFYQRDGLVVNGATGTITVHDYWSSLEQVNNHGTITIAAGGFMQQPYNPLINTGALINRDRCDLRELNSSAGTVELVKDCNVRTKATFTASSTLRPHSSSAALAKVIVAQSSPIGGTVSVVTDGTPPAPGTIRDLISGPVSGTFSAVTSASPAVGYAAIYKNDNSAVQLEVTAPAAITAIVPARLLDTRPGEDTVDGVDEGGGVRAADSTTELLVIGRANVPADATAVVLNVTATQSEGPGFATVFPCGTTRPTASNLNFGTGSTIPNGVISKIGTGGKVCLYASTRTHLLADITGYFTASSPYKPLVPARLLDTRPGEDTIDGVGEGGGPAVANTVTEVQVTDRGGVPAGATAVVLNVTVTQAQGFGFVAVYPCGSTRPTASNLNFAVGSTVPNNVIAKVGDGGKVCLYTSNATHLIVDVNGYFTSSPSFTAMVPRRLLDTRPGEETADGAGAGGGPAVGGTLTEVQVTDRVSVPGGATAAVLNITVTQTQGPGFVTVFPCGTTRPTASSLNYGSGTTIPNNVIAKIGSGGKVCLYASQGTHLIADVNGYFTT